MKIIFFTLFFVLIFNCHCAKIKGLLPIRLGLPEAGVPAPIIDFQCGKRRSILFPSFSRISRSTKLVRKFIGTPDAPLVVGGEDSFRNEWPWMALLGRSEGNRIIYFCDGVLINLEWILTAAHCVLELDPFFVRLGEQDYSTDGDYANPVDFVVKTIILHPHYNLDLGYNDLALVQLDTKAPLNAAGIRPICLPWGAKTDRDLTQKQVTLTGWGTKLYGGSLSSILQEVVITVYDASVCNSSYSTLRDFSSVWPNGMTNENIVCVGELTGGKDACQGDSGGPIVYQELDGTYTLVGIVSKGHGCGKANFPGIYAPVYRSKYLSWIKEVAFA